MQKSDRVEFIDFGKGLAILTIVVAHYFSPYLSGLLQKALMVGGSGVHLFFVASGFGLALSVRRESVAAFYARRLPHLLMPYYAVVLLSFAINLVHPYFGSEGAYALAGHLLLFKMFDERIVDSFGYQFWFISTIVQFYLMYPVLQRGLEAVGLKGFAGLTLLTSIGYSLFVAFSGFAQLRTVNSFFLQYLWEFGLGMVMASHFTRTGKGWWEQPVGLLIALSVLGLGLMAWMALAGGPIGRVLNDIPASIGYCAFCAFLYQMTAHHGRFLRRALSGLGRISYELYMLHVLIVLVVTDWLGGANRPGSMLLYSAVLIFPIALAAAKLYAEFNKKWLYPALARFQRGTLTRISIATKGQVR
jgi:peptidoglycan/LPS O-acetylase OafA/YrhL